MVSLSPALAFALFIAAFLVCFLAVAVGLFIAGAGRDDLARSTWRHQMRLIVRVHNSILAELRGERSPPSSSG